MATKLNDQAYDHARNLIRDGRWVLDQRDDWSEHRPTASQENSYLAKHGWSDYQKWYLAIDDDENEDTKARYKFPYGDFGRIHRCAVISAESRAGQYKHPDVEKAAQELLSMLNDVTVT